MDKYSRAYERFAKSFNKFREIIENPTLPEFFKEEFLIEITTKRFEYTFESMWKAVKEFLRKRGISCNSPKSCFTELLKEGVVPEKYEKTLSDMILIRNSLVHVYDELSAKEFYEKIKEKRFLETFEAVLNGMREN